MRLIDADALKKQAYPFPCAIGTENAVPIRAISDAPTVPTWIKCSDRLPEPEQRVLVCAETRCGGKALRHITTAMYEDGNVWREESSWSFNEFEHLDTYDEEKDDWRIPEGWWEYTIYNNEEGNYPIDDFVTHWMPLPTRPDTEEKS